MSDTKVTPLKRQFGDRYDGWRVHSNDALFSVIPHVLNNRCDSQVFFDESIDINELEQFIRNLRRTTTMKDLSTLHVMMAAFVRIISQYPGVNRFICGRKIYARNKIVFAFNIKKEMKIDAEEACIKVEFSPGDTLWDVYEKVNTAIQVNKEADTQNDTDNVAKLFSFCPSFVVKFVIFLMKKLDAVGLMPKAINEFSPFHSTLYITDMGSTGLGSVFHHLYNFGTCTLFCCLGKKGRRLKVNEEGKVQYGRTLNLRFTVDERVVDGYYYAVTIRELMKLFKHPESLLEKPDCIVPDPGIRLSRKEKRILKKQRKLERQTNAI